jgi:hypothetical protein
MAILFFLEKFCRVPVKNAWGKKKPEIQNTLGVPSFIQFVRKVILSLASWIQDASGFKERKPFSYQLLGTMLSKMELAIFSSSSLMTISPLSAF